MHELFVFLGELLGIIVFSIALLVIVVFLIHEGIAAFTAISTTDNKENNES